MPQKFTDKQGRPVVAVTGMGVVTSLGQGKEANWAKLTQGVSGVGYYPVPNRRTEDHDCRHCRLPCMCALFGACAVHCHGGSSRA